MRGCGPVVRFRVDFPDKLEFLVAEAQVAALAAVHKDADVRMTAPDLEVPFHFAAFLSCRSALEISMAASAAVAFFARLRRRFAMPKCPARTLSLRFPGPPILPAALHWS